MAHPRLHYPRPLPRYQYDNPAITAALLSDMLGAIDLTPASERADMINAAAADHGGYVSAPQTRAGGWGPHHWEIGLIGIMGMGPDFDGALHNWTKCARRQIEGQIEGQITPTAQASAA